MKAVVIVKPGFIDDLNEILSEIRGIGNVSKIRLLHPDRKTWELHYAPHKGKDFFDRLINYMVSGPVVVIVFNLWHVTTNPLKGVRDRIRENHRPFISPEQNVIHASDGHADAVREVLLWEPML